MANHKSAKKRIRLSRDQNRRNRHYKSMMQSSIKKLKSETDKDAAEQQLKQTVSLLDRLACKGIIHRNNAANKKSRLTRSVNKLA